MLPGGDVGEPGVVALGLTLRSLELLAEMGAAGFLPGQGIAQHQVRQAEEILEPQGPLQSLIGPGAVVGHPHPIAELLAQGLHCCQPPPQLRGAAADAAHLDHQQAQLPMQIRDGAAASAIPPDWAGRLRPKGGNADLGRGYRRAAGRVVGTDLRLRMARQPGRHGGWGDEVAIGQTLHQGTGSEPIGAVLREIGLPEHKQSRNRAHQVVIHPQAPHRVVRRGIDAQGRGDRIFAGDARIHLQQVAVAALDRLPTVAADRLRQIQVHPAAARPHATALQAQLPGAAGGHITGHHVAVGGVLAFQEVIAFRLGNRRGLPSIPRLRRQPDAAVIAQALAHQGELALPDVAGGDAGGMDLGEARIGEAGPLKVGPPDGADIALHRIGGEIEHIRIAAAGQ